MVVVVVARWAATHEVSLVWSAVGVCEVMLAMVPCASMMDIVVVAPRIVGVMWSTIG